MTTTDIGGGTISRTSAAALIAALPASDRSRLLIVGEPGIGKSSLVGGAGNRFALSGALVLRANPSFAERHTTYSLLWDLLSGIDLGSLDGIAGEHRSILEIALGQRSASTEIPALATALAFENILRELSAQSPVVLVIDDLHWSDPESIAVVERALRHLPDRPIRLVATSRTAEGRTTPAAGLRFESTQVYSLDGLSVDELERFARPAWPSTPTRAQITALREHTGGNPMWALELIRRGAINELGALQIGTLDAPPSLAAAVADRLRALSGPAADVVAIVALLGRPRLGLLGEVLRFSHIEEGAIDEAENAGFLDVTTTTASTRHPLHASAATSSLSPSRRRELHAFIAQAIADPVVRAQHLQQSEPPGPDETIAIALTKAAVLLRQRGARLRSAHFDAQAVERTDPSAGTYQHRLLTLAQHLFSAGDDRACRFALMRVSPSLLDIAHYDTWVALTISAAPAQARTFLDSTIAPDAVRAAILTANSAVAPGLRVSERASLSSAALAALSGADTPNANHRALRGMARSRLDAGDALDGSIIAEMDRRQAIQLVVALDDTGIATAGFLAHLADDVDLSRRSLATVTAWARSEGKEGIERVFLAHSALVEVVGGNVGAGRRLAAQSGFDISSPDLPARLQPMAGMLLVSSGRHDDLRNAVTAWSASSADGELELAGLLGFSAIARRKWREAIPHLRTAARIADERELLEPGSRFRVDLPLVEALLQSGDTGEAGVRLDRIRTFLRQRDRPISRIGLHRMTSLQLASSGDLAAALGEATCAVDLANHHQRHGDHLLALLQRARILRRLRRQTQARDDVAAAGRLFEEAGSEDLRAHLEAAATGTRRVASSTQLTQSERRVESLVRDGLSNGEIAAALFVSIRTVESHISAILRKTGSGSRSKLIARD